MPKFTIYKTDSPDDVAAFLTLFEPNGEPSIHPRLVIDENEWDLWLAEANGELVGGALCCEVVDEAGDGRGGEDDLIVDAPFRRQGLARQLMAVVESYYEGCGLVGMQTGGSADDARVISMFESLGYRIVKR